MFDIKQKISDFKVQYKNKCYALMGWKNLKMKDFGLNEMLECICKAANGSLKEMAKIIEHLTSKDKVQGRTQVYADDKVAMVDLVRNENGEITLKGYNPDAKLPEKGQHIVKGSKENKNFKNGTNEPNKTAKKIEDKINDLGAKVKELYPGQDKQYILFAMKAIRKYAEGHKIHPDKVINGLKKGRLILDDELWRIVPVVKENKEKHTIVINESDMDKIIDFIEMTEHKFFTNMKNFIAMLLQDPVNTKVPPIFAQRNYTRSSLLNYLLSGKDPILIRDQRISDRDENGEPKTATMMVKFRCPRKNFERKLEKLYMRMFEKNLPPRKEKEPEVTIVLAEDDVDEATGCGGSGAAGGAFVAPMAPVQRRQMPVEIGESTTTFNTGKYIYDRPAFGDEESCARHDGDGGSVSVNQTPKKKKS